MPFLSRAPQLITVQPSWAKNSTGHRTVIISNQRRRGPISVIWQFLIPEALLNNHLVNIPSSVNSPDCEKFSRHLA